MATRRDETDIPSRAGITFSGSAWKQAIEGEVTASANPLVSQLAEAMATSWRRGENSPAESFLANCPEIHAEDAVRLIYEEICLREESGQSVDPVEILRRFPKWRDELEILFKFHRVLLPTPPHISFPEVGQELLGFRLMEELGRGALGRVFLASQPSLADRPVVLKVSPRGHEEHLSLARLQHMHIVPIHSEQVVTDRNLSVICMPYMGGATLARVLEHIADCPITDRSGRDLFNVVDQTQSTLTINLPARGPFREYLERCTYVQAVCWIAACLADGLQYAHDRGLVHMDVKPSNVLIAGDGQPMLLDFHLAREPIRPDVPVTGRVGGTAGYMSPEHRAAMRSVREGRAVSALVDGRADVYSLGVLIYRMLGGPLPGATEAPTEPLRRFNPRVSIGLSDIVFKCLRDEPGDRYSNAASLSADLRRHLNDLPLIGVPNRSFLERWRKWRHRQPQALSRNIMLATATAFALVAGTILAGAYRQRIREIENALSDGRTFHDHHQYPEANRVLNRGLTLADATPRAGDLKRSLESELAGVLRDRQSEEFHGLVDLIRFRYGSDPKPSEETLSFVSRGRTIWKVRDRLIGPTGTEGRTEAETRIRNDLLDFAVIWADLRVRLTPDAGSDEARREALQVLADAEALLGASPTLSRYRHEFTRVADETDSTLLAAVAPRSAWEYYDLGRFLIRTGDLELASEQFQKALEIRPQDFWTNFFQGICAYRLKRFDEAIEAFRVCIALTPEAAECYYNRALAYEAVRKSDPAIRDYSRALELKTDLTQAALNRGVLLSGLGRYAEAIADLNHAMKTTIDRRLLGRIRYRLAQVQLSKGDRSTALSNLKLAVDDYSEEARALLERLVKEGK